MARTVYTNLETIVSTLVILACILLFVFFPAAGLFQIVVKIVAFMILLPMAYIRFVLRKKLSSFGIQKGDWRRGLLGIFFSAALAAPLLFILANYTGFLGGYQMIGFFRGEFVKYLFYEVVFVGTMVLTMEIFFRGFVMNTFLDKIGLWAILVQSLFLFAFFFLGQSLTWEVALYLLIAPFAGFIALWSRSLLYSFAFSWIFILIADAVLIRIIK